MRNTYIAVAVMTAIVLAALSYGFLSTGSPWAVRGYNLDTTRMTDFSEIQSAVQEYYEENSQLPATFAQLASSTEGSYYAEEKIFDDPETQQPYTYQTTGQMSYQLCTTFAASSAVENEYNGDSEDYYPEPAGGATTHTAGYDCLTYSVTGVAQPQESNPSEYDNYLGASSTPTLSATTTASATLQYP